MITSMASGATGSGSRASRNVLAGIAPRYKTLRTPYVVPDLNIDGGVGLSVAARKAVPVVLLPLFSDSLHAIPGIVDAVYRLQQTSLEFRVVVLTDQSSFKQLRSYGWAITHVQSEVGWKRGSWSAYAAAELIQIYEAFGCSYLIGVSEYGIDASSWQTLLTIAKIGTDLPNVSQRNPTNDASLACHSSWRGWLDTIPSGESKHRVEVGDAAWSVEILRRADSSVVIVQLGTENRIDVHDPELTVGFNLVRMRCLGDTVESTSSWLDGILALFDGLSLADVGILELEKHLSSKFESLPPSIVKTTRIDPFDIANAERRALSTWSSTL